RPLPAPHPHHLLPLHPAAVLARAETLPRRRELPLLHVVEPVLWAPAARLDADRLHPGPPAREDDEPAPPAAPPLREPRLQPRHARLLQVRELRRRQPLPPARLHRAAALGHPAADRDLLLHVRVARLHDQRLSRRAGVPEPARLLALPVVLPTPRRRS